MNFRREPERAPPEEGSNAAGGASLPPDALIIVPVRETVLMPGTVFPVTIGRPRSIAAAQQAVREERQIGVLMQRAANVEDPSALDLHRTGTVANMLRYVTAPGRRASCRAAGRAAISRHRIRERAPLLHRPGGAHRRAGGAYAGDRSAFPQLEAASDRGAAAAAASAARAYRHRPGDRRAGRAGRPRRRLYRHQRRAETGIARDRRS